MVQLSTTDPKKTITTKLSSVELFWFIRFDIKISATDCGYKVTIFNLEKKKKILQSSSHRLWLQCYLLFRGYVNFVTSYSCVVKKVF